MEHYRYTYVHRTDNIRNRETVRQVGPVPGDIHIHQHEEIMLIPTDGRCCLTNNGNFVTVKTPALVVNRAGTFHEMVEVYEGPLICKVCSYHKRILSPVAPQLCCEAAVYQDSDMLVLPLSDRQSASVEVLLDQMSVRSLPQKRLLLLCVLEQMAQLLQEGVVPVRVRSAQNYIFQVTALLQDPQSEALTLPELAQRFHVSQTKLKNDFKKIAAMPIHTFRRREQMNNARMLLETTQTDIAQIAYTCGFYDESYFIRAFRKEYGITPGRYRKQLKEQ